LIQTTIEGYQHNYHRVLVEQHACYTQDEREEMCWVSGHGCLIRDELRGGFVCACCGGRWKDHEEFHREILRIEAEQAQAVLV